MPQPLLDLRSADPPFLFVTLLAARKAGDVLLETLARGWLAEQGIVVLFANELSTPEVGMVREKIENPPPKPGRAQRLLSRIAKGSKSIAETLSSAKAIIELFGFGR